MNTNGSARTVKWWRELAKTGVRIRFGIDGLEDTHKLYRIGTDWKMIMRNAKAFIDAGGDAWWDMLIFEHNKHQVEDCKQLATDMGFLEFIPKHTSRFKQGFVQVLTKEGTTSHYIYPSERSKEFAITFMEYKIEENKEIHCKAKEQKTVSINAHGEISACCWMDFAADMPMGYSNVDYKDMGFINPSLKKNTLSEIFNSDYFDKIEATWDTKPLRVCSKQCGKFDKLGAQF
jgi:sulfatase maturation enzyme AslB (radical SAM superfamily)